MCLKIVFCCWKVTSTSTSVNVVRPRSFISYQKACLTERKYLNWSNRNRPAISNDMSENNNIRRRFNVVESNDSLASNEMIRKIRHKKGSQSDKVYDNKYGKRTWLHNYGAMVMNEATN